ncbi:MAG: uracil-DNA glycosylase [Patescibacteria group bacterium]
MNNNTNNRTGQLKKIKDAVFNLKESPLYNYRQQNNYFPVLGEGSHNARIMFIGEAPGVNEAKSGRPFCGAAGKILDELLESANINRTDVYITNIVKDRPPGNRDPLPEEIAIYSPFLNEQINVIQPRALATLGRFSMYYIMEKFGLENELEPISQMHGRMFTSQTPYGQVKIIPLYHPAVAVYNPHAKEGLKKDFAILKTIMLE